MLHLIQYDFKKNFRNMNVIFWPLIFPLIMATLFYFAFGRMEEADFETVAVAFVEEEETEAGQIFREFLTEMGQEDTPLIRLEMLTEEQAKEKLRNREVTGIYFAGDTPELMVDGTGIEESILETILNSYNNARETIQKVMQTHPEGLSQAIAQMQNYDELVSQASLGGRTTNGNVQFFYALIAMACLYGCFIGLGVAICLQANLTALAARRCVTPTHKLQLILSEMVVAFGLHFVNVIILLLYLKFILKMEFEGQFFAMLPAILVGSMLGVAMGILIGSAGKLGEGMKVGMMLGVSLLCSFGAGLMNSEMKYIVEQHFPFLNRINPAALISDALYCVNVYDDPIRYRNSLITLTAMCVVFLAASYLMIRRESYDSI